MKTALFVTYVYIRRVTTDFVIDIIKPLSKFDMPGFDRYLRYTFKSLFKENYTYIFVKNVFEYDIFRARISVRVLHICSDIERFFAQTELQINYAHINFNIFAIHIRNCELNVE